MKPVSKLPILALFVAALLLTACDPGHSGETFVRNETAYPLRFHYVDHQHDTILAIPANSTVSVYNFGGIGAGSVYDCCPCEFLSVALQPDDSSKTVTKDIADAARWTLDNPNKSKFNNREIRCEFVVTTADIQ